MGSRLPGFDYSRPYFYMVTVRRLEGFPALSRVVGDEACHYLEPNAITRLFVDIIKTFHETWYCIEPITCFSIMPDHLHLLIKIRKVEKRVSLAVIVRMLTRALEKAYFANFAPGEAGDEEHERAVQQRADKRVQAAEAEAEQQSARQSQHRNGEKEHRQQREQRDVRGRSPKPERLKHIAQLLRRQHGGKAQRKNRNGDDRSCGAHSP